MKKTFIISVIALGFGMTILNANPEINYENNTSIQSVKQLSPLCMAVVKGDFDTVKKLVDWGSDVNQKSIGMTPAMYAARSNRVKILKLLITHGAKLKVKSDFGYTAKRYAEMSNATDAMLLIEKVLEKKSKV